MDGCRFRLVLEAPIEPDRSRGNSREIARDMTARLYRRFQSWIGEYPEQWLCIKRRWPDLNSSKWQARRGGNPRLPRESNPIPDGLTSSPPPI